MKKGTSPGRGKRSLNIILNSTWSLGERKKRNNSNHTKYTEREEEAEEKEKNCAWSHLTCWKKRKNFANSPDAWEKGSQKRVLSLGKGKSGFPPISTLPRSERQGKVVEGKKSHRNFPGRGEGGSRKHSEITACDKEEEKKKGRKKEGNCSGPTNRQRE